TLPLLAIIGTLAVALLLGAHRQARGSDARERTSRELRHAALVLAAELRPLRSVDLVAWTDTSFDFDVLVGAGIACGTRGTLRAIHLLPAQRDDPAGTAWIASPETLDDVTAWQLAPEPSAPAALVRHTLDRVTPASTCAVSPLQGSTGLGVTLVLRDSLSRQVEEGTPVRVLRRTRYALYRSSDGFWYLGRRSRDGGTWTVIQPVVGPLLSAAAGGVSFSVSDEAGSRLASGGAGAVAMHVGLRAVRGESGARPESTHVEIALRGHHEP
ncbi:MAG TPA: hypothetical protein VE869_16890, partial [Gemmatimonas sp.]|nr:hypothetical protein [Gemmatimonas sp.]